LFARRREEFGGLELHTLAELEGVAQAIGRDFPAFGQARLDLRTAMLELDETAVDRTRGGVERGAGGVERRVEALRRTFRAIDESFGRSREGKGRNESCGCEKRRDLLHGFPLVVSATQVQGRGWRKWDYICQIIAIRILGFFFQKVKNQHLSQKDISTHLSH
jgi:hypothetical protein